MMDLAMPFAPVRKDHRKCVVQLPNLILKITEEVKVLRTSDSELHEEHPARGISVILTILIRPLDKVQQDVRVRSNAFVGLRPLSKGQSLILAIRSSLPQGSYILNSNLD